MRDNLVGVIVYSSPYSLFNDNVFSGNQFEVSGFGGLGFRIVPSIAKFDNGERGNYWDSYSGKDTNNDGLGDSAHIIDENNQDNYPLMNPNDIPEFPSLIILPLFLAATLSILVFRKRSFHKGLQDL